MDNLLQDLVHLVLTALPTTFLLIVLWIFFKKVLFDPLQDVIAERDAATKGAVESAKQALSLAEAKTAEYEIALRAARGEILRAQDGERQKLRRRQSELVAEARESGARQVETARNAIAAEADAARQSLRADAERLAGEIMETVLKGSRA
jgi:F0F1-type ATP synthase membrane subunit b/b'